MWCASVNQETEHDSAIRFHLIKSWILRTIDEQENLSCLVIDEDFHQMLRDEHSISVLPVQPFVDGIHKWTYGVPMKDCRYRQVRSILSNVLFSVEHDDDSFTVMESIFTKTNSPPIQNVN